MCTTAIYRERLDQLALHPEIGLAVARAAVPDNEKLGLTTIG